MAGNSPKILIQICYAEPDRQILREFEVQEGTTLGEAIELSNIAVLIPEWDSRSVCVGIYGKVKPMKWVVQKGDRIEIYRPLRVDPKEARKRRALKKEKAARK